MIDFSRIIVDASKKYCRQISEGQHIINETFQFHGSVCQFRECTWCQSLVYYVPSFLDVSAIILETSSLILVNNHSSFFSVFSVYLLFKVPNHLRLFCSLMFDAYYFLSLLQRFLGNLQSSLWLVLSDLLYLFKFSSLLMMSCLILNIFFLVLILLYVLYVHVILIRAFEYGFSLSLSLSLSLSPYLVPVLC